MNRILITGATGKLGSAVIDRLKERTSANRIAALVRDSSKAGQLIRQGIEICYGNYDDPGSLDTAMRCIDKVLLISGTDAAKRFIQHKNVIDAAKNNAVKFIAYTGVSMKDVQSSELNFLMSSHFETEEYLKASGVTYTILRNTLYAEDLPYYTGQKEAFSRNGIFIPAATGKVPFALREEMAEAFANLLLEKNHFDRICEIGNSTAFSFAEISDMLGKITGTQVPYLGNDPELYASLVKKMNLPELIATFLIGTSEDIKNDQYNITTGDLEQLLGRKPASLVSILKKVYLSGLITTDR